MPTLLPDEHQQPVDAEAITSFCTLCQIIQLQGKITRFLRIKYGKESNEEMTTNEELKLQKHLIDCFDHIQQRHTNHIHTMTKRSSTYEPNHNAHLSQISLHFTAILLYRPYVMSDLKLREKCVVAATTLGQLVDDLIKCTGSHLISLFGIPRGLQQLIYYMTASITIHRLVQSWEGKKKKKKKRGKATSNRSSKQVDKALDIIHTLFLLQNQVPVDDDIKVSVSTFNQQHRYSAPSMMQHYPSSLTSSSQQQPSCTFNAVNNLPLTTPWFSSANKSFTAMDSQRTSTLQQYKEIPLHEDLMSIDRQGHSMLDIK